MEFLNSILPAIEHSHILGYWIVLFAALLETIVGIGLVLPGSTIILIMGTLAGKGYLNLDDLIWFAVIGAILGDNANYYLGKKYGLRLLQKGIPFLKPQHLTKVKSFFKKHGAKSIFLGRFVPSLKETVPFIAGTIGMKQTTFMFWNALGALGWSLEWILPGYIFAQSLKMAETWLSRTGFFFTMLLVLFIFFYILKWLIAKKGKQFFTFSASVWQSIKLAITNNPHVQKLAKKHALFFKFIKSTIQVFNHIINMFFRPGDAQTVTATFYLFYQCRI